MGYGNEESRATMDRAAYGSNQAALMRGGEFYGGASQGISNLGSDIGQYIMPVSYSPPVRYHAGYYGMYQQHTSMMRDLAGMVGLHNVPRGTTALEYNTTIASDFGERYAAGLAGAGLAVGGMAAQMALAPAGTAMGSAAGHGIAAAMGMGEIGGSAMGMVGGFVGGTIAPLALAAGATYAIGNAVAQRREISSFLEQGSFRFVGAGSGMADNNMLGGGMNIASRRESAEFIRKMDVSDPKMGMKDLTNILEQGTQLGLFNGTKDMEDFKTKFKDITEAVKNVTRTLHQTLEEGMKTIKDLRGIGVDPSQVKSIVMEADTFGKMAGRTGAEMLGLGLQGAELFRGTNVTMGIGAQATMMNLASIRAARDAGTLSQESIAQAGGEEALAMRQTAGGLSFAQSAMGRGMGAAFMGAGGGFSANTFMANVQAGGGNFVGQAGMAAGNLATPSGVIGFQANQAKFMSDMGAQYGGRGLQVYENAATASYASYIAGATGAKTADVFRLTMKQNGKSDADIDAILAEAKGADKIFATSQAAVEATRAKQAMEEAHDSSRFANLSGKIGNLVSRAADAAGGRAISQFYDEQKQGAIDWMNKTVNSTQRVDATAVSAAGRVAGGNFAAGKSTGPTNLDVGGGLSGSGNAGSQTLEALQANNGELARDLGINIQHGTPGTGDVILKSAITVGKGRDDAFVSRKELEAGQRQLSVNGMSDESAKKMEENGLLKKVSSTAVVDAAIAGRMKGVQTYDALAVAAFGDSVVGVGGKVNLTKEQTAALLLQTKDNDALRDIVVNHRNESNRVANGINAVASTDLLKSATTYDLAAKTLGEKLNLNVTPDMAGAMAAARNEKDDGKRAKLIQEAVVAAKAANPTADLGKMTADVTTGIMENGAELTAISGSIGNVKQIQARRGQSAIAAVLDSELTNNKDLSAKDRAALDKVIGGIGSALTPADLTSAVHGNEGLLKKLGGSSNLLEGVKNLEGMKNTDSVEARKQFQDTLSKYASDKTSITPGNVSSTANGGGLTSDQVAIQQTAINTEVLNAMKALATRLKLN